MMQNDVFSFPVSTFQFPKPAINFLRISKLIIREEERLKMRSLWLSFLVVNSISLANSLSSPSPPEIEPRQFIQLTNPINTRVQQSIPASFVGDWPTWVLDEEGNISKIPDDEGFVSPTSIDELWHPVDLVLPTLKLALGLHVREGVIRHCMPAVDLAFDGRVHRNRGMCSVPRAHSWIDFSLSLDEWENFKIVLSSKEKDESDWTKLAVSSPNSISGAIERAVLFLSETAPDALGVGSHILNVILTIDGDDLALECPRNEMRVLMDDDDFIDDPEAASGVLEVAISSSIAGSESEYLPYAYKPLYENESLRNPLYAKFKKRQEERAQERNNK